MINIQSDSKVMFLATNGSMQNKDLKKMKFRVSKQDTCQQDRDKQESGKQDELNKSVFI